MINDTGKNTKASGYLMNYVTSEGMSKAVNSLTRKLKKLTADFDAIAFRGISGALVAPNVAQRLNKDVIFVRKGEVNHSGLYVEGVLNSRYVIIDDMVALGGTITTIHDEIEKWDKKSKLVGVALYSTFRTDTQLVKFLKKNDYKNVWIIHNETTKPIYPQFTDF